MTWRSKNQGPGSMYPDKLGKVLSAGLQAREYERLQALLLQPSLGCTLVNLPDVCAKTSFQGLPTARILESEVGVSHTGQYVTKTLVRGQ